jgi:hypothetical protein
MFRKVYLIILFLSIKVNLPGGFSLLQFNTENACPVAAGQASIAY